MRNKMVNTMSNQNIFNLLFYPALITIFYKSYKKGNELILVLLTIVIITHIINDSGILATLPKDVKKFYDIMKDIFALIFGIVFIYFGINEKLYFLVLLGIIMILIHVYYLYDYMVSTRKYG